MPPMVCEIDSDARVELPASFAGATVLIEEVSETELRIRKTDPAVFAEEERKPMAARDWEIFQAMLENPPPPNEALLAAARKYKSRG